MKTRKLVSAILISSLALSLLGGCTQKEPESEKYKVGVCQLTGHNALDQATLGFVDALNEKLGDRVEIEVFVGDGSEEKCKEIVDGFVDENVDLIMANATPALVAATEATGTIPIVATSITSYGTALGIRKWSGITGLNVTGTSDLAPIDQQEKIIFEIAPDAKKVGIIFCQYEGNSVYQADAMGKAISADGKSYNAYPIKKESDLEEMARLAASECDVIYLPTDNTLAANAEKLRDIFIEAGVPAVAGEEGICVAGVATLSINYYNIGYNAGLMAVEILENDAEVGLMEIRYADEFVKKYNEENAKTLGIKIPEDYTKIEY